MSTGYRKTSVLFRQIWSCCQWILLSIILFHSYIRFPCQCSRILKVYVFYLPCKPISCRHGYWELDSYFFSRNEPSSLTKLKGNNKTTTKVLFVCDCVTFVGVSVYTRFLVSSVPTKMHPVGALLDKFRIYRFFLEAINNARPVTDHLTNRKLFSVHCRLGPCSIISSRNMFYAQWTPL